jgi:nitrogenase molybdenum-iron protein NifN
MDQIATVMSADENVIEGLRTICEKSQPDVIGLPTTGLSETQGTDILRLVREFRTTYPAFDHVAVIPVNTPDFTGSLESGFALVVEAIITTLVPQTRHPGKRRRQVNILASAALTPGDIEVIKDWCEHFGLRPVVLPDIGDALDGHLIEAEHSPLSLGGTPRDEIAAMGESIATLVIGASLHRAADALAARTGVPDRRFAHLMGLDACDAFTQALAELSANPVPPRLERERAQLQDAMVDCHFMTGFQRVALAAEPDLLAGMNALFTGMGAEIVAAVSPVGSESLKQLACATVQIGDLQDLENAARAVDAQLVVGSSHAAQSAERLGVPLLRAGFPLYDRVGGFARPWVGYRATRQALFDIANLVLEQHHDIPAYRSVFWSGGPRDCEAPLPASPRVTGVVRH